MKRVKLAIDFGSANMKMFGMINGQERKRIVRSLATNDGIQEYRVVNTNGKKVYFGVGEPLVVPDKTRREYILESIFLATNEIYGELNEAEFEVELGIGLPILQFKSNKRKSYEEELQRDYVNEVFSATVDGKPYTIKIKFLKIYAEGFSGFLTFADELPTDKPILLIDIGYKTTEAIGIRKDLNGKKLIIDNYGSIDTGMLEVFNTIRKQFINKTGMMYKLETIENAMIANETLTVNNEDVDARKFLVDGVPVIKNILNSIETEYFPDMKNRKIFLIGGGIEFIYSLLKFIGKEDDYRKLDINMSNDIEKSMFANVLGYYMQLMKDTITIVESEEVFVSDKKLDVAITKN
jgi:hypothetical protein